MWMFVPIVTLTPSLLYFYYLNGHAKINMHVHLKKPLRLKASAFSKSYIVIEDMNLYIAIEDITFYIAIEASVLEHCKIFFVLSSWVVGSIANLHYYSL